MLNLKLQDKIPCSEIRKRTSDIEYTLKQKWRWDGYIISKNEGQHVDQTLHRVATKEREEIKRTTIQKMAR